MYRNLLISLITIVWGSLCIASTVMGQGRSFWDDTDLDTFRAGGSIGLTASAYSVDGIENRRAPGMIETNANVNFNMFGLRSGITMNYSTDDSRFRQNMNTFSYDATWRWINIQAGDVNMRFSQYGLNGAVMRGGYLKLDPGNFLLELTGGRSKRAVRPSLESGFRRPAFEQWAGAMKIGYGSTSRSYFHLSTFYARDEKDSIGGGEIEIDPRENLSITPDFQVQLFGGRLTFGSEVTASIFTRDLNSDAVPLSEVGVPSFFTNFYTPRVSSRINYAGVADASLNLDFFNLGLGYERVQPGFESLGRGSVRDDQEKISISPTLRLLQNRINISSNLGLGRDNLLGNRIQTQNNTNFNSNVQFVITEDLSLNTTYGLILNRVSVDQTQEGVTGSDQSQVSHNIMVQPSLTVRGEEFTHNVSLSGGYMLMKSMYDDADQVGGADYSSTSITTGLNYSITFPGGISVNSSVNYMNNSSDDIEINNMGFTLGTSYAFFNRRVNVSANAGLNRNSSEREAFDGELVTTRLQQITGTLNSSYNLSDKDSFTLTLRTRKNSVVEGAGQEFTELEGSFRYQRRF